MIYVGIDIAKQTHYASIMTSDGEILAKPFDFSNDHGGFQKLLKHLEPFPKNTLLIGMESTAHYSENLLSFLFTRDYRLCIINPIQTSVLKNQISERPKPILWIHTSSSRFFP